MRLQRMCRELKKRDHLSSFLKSALQSALDACISAHGGEDFGEDLDPPPIVGTHFERNLVHVNFWRKLIS
jgi:hypothetical protein